MAVEALPSLSPNSFLFSPRSLQPRPSEAQRPLPRRVPSDKPGNVHEHAAGRRRRVEERGSLVKRRVAQPLAWQVDAVSEAANRRGNGLDAPVLGAHVLEDDKLDLAGDVPLFLELQQVLLPVAGRGELDDLSARIDGRCAVERRDDDLAGREPRERDVADRVLEVGRGQRDGALEGGVDDGVRLVLVPLLF